MFLEHHEAVSLIRASPPPPHPCQLMFPTPTNKKVQSFAEECCKTMAVIGARLRRHFPPPLSRSPSPSINNENPLGNNSACADPQQKQPPRSFHRRHVLVAAAVHRLAEACAPGLDSDEVKRGFPGLSLTTAMLSAGKKPGPRIPEKSSTALAGACAALHAHLLEWLALVAEDVDGTGELLLGGGGGVALPAAGGGAAREVAQGCSGRDFLVGFARRVLLDLLVLFERNVFTAWGRRREGGDQEETVCTDPSAELLCAVMDTLDGANEGKPLLMLVLLPTC